MQYRDGDTYDIEHKYVYKINAYTNIIQLLCSGLHKDYNSWKTIFLYKKKYQDNHDVFI